MVVLGPRAVILPRLDEDSGSTGHDRVKMLGSISRAPDRRRRLWFLAHMNRVLCRLDHYLKAGDTWYETISGTAPGATGCQSHCVAYFP